jgi:IS30 family transposase
MPQGYHHLAFDQRCQIFILRQEGFSQAEIAAKINSTQSTISRELRRNVGKFSYEHKHAQERSDRRRALSGVSKRKIKGDLRKLICTMITQEHSPDEISGRLKLENKAFISHETIYKYIRPRDQFHKHLRRQARPYLKRKGSSAFKGPIKNRVGIEHRPKEVDEKLRVGDFEADTIIGSKQTGAIVSLVDRKTKLVKLRLVHFKSAAGVADAMITSLNPIKGHLHTITSDNGSEFAWHEQVAAELDIGFYFARPYHSWERGLNENTNGLVRQYFPKRTDFSTITERQVLNVERKLNNRPRKTLGYKTPNEVFLELTGFDCRL